MKRREREHQANRRAIRIGNGKPFGLLAPSLRIDEGDVISVNLRDDERHVGLHAKGAGVGNDCAPGIGELRLQFASDGGIERGEDNSWGAVGLGGRNCHVGDPGGNYSFQSPARGFGIRTALGSIGSGEPCHLKPWMML